jgi:hypothetical protein
VYDHYLETGLVGNPHRVGLVDFEVLDLALDEGLIQALGRRGPFRL